MIYVHNQSEVEDYDRWRAVFDENEPVRRAAGSTGASVYVDANNPQRVFVIVAFLSVEHAQTFSQSPELREAMKNAGVMGPPIVTFLEMMD